MSENPDHSPEGPPRMPDGVLRLPMAVKVHRELEGLQQAVQDAEYGLFIQVEMDELELPSKAALHVGGIDPGTARMLLAVYAQLLDQAELHAPECTCGEDEPEIDLPEHRMVNEDSGSPACACGWTPSREDRASGNGIGAVIAHLFAPEAGA